MNDQDEHQRRYRETCRYEKAYALGADERLSFWQSVALWTIIGIVSGLVPLIVALAIER